MSYSFDLDGMACELEDNFLRVDFDEDRTRRIEGVVSERRLPLFLSFC